jgi:hypothetical protein
VIHGDVSAVNAIINSNGLWKALVFGNRRWLSKSGVILFARSGTTYPFQASLSPGSKLFSLNWKSSLLCFRRRIFGGYTFYYLVGRRRKN